MQNPAPVTILTGMQCNYGVKSTLRDINQKLTNCYFRVNARGGVFSDGSVCDMPGAILLGFVVLT